MKNLKSCTLLIIIILVPNLVFGQRKTIHNRDENTFAHMSEVLDEFQELGRIGVLYNNPGECKITWDNYGYLILVKYLGEMRQIGKEKKELLVNSFKTIGYGEIADNIFTHEVHVQTDSGRFWIPIQTQIINYWNKELETNDSVLIYIRIHAAYDADDENKWLFVINSFCSSVTEGLWNEAVANLQKGNDVIGNRCIDELIRINPGDGRNYALLAYCYATKGNTVSKKKLKDRYYYQSDSLFNISEKLSPEYCHQYYYRAVLNFYRSDYINSWKMIEKARELNDKEIDGEFLRNLENKLSYNEFKKQ